MVGGKMAKTVDLKESIMVVDDDPDILLIINDFLIKEGYNVVSAKNGEEAVNKVKTQKIDLILMDIAMPKLNGVEAIKEIRKIKPKMPYIMITAFTDASKGLNVSGSECFLKPFDLSYLLKSVKAKLRSRTPL